MEMVAAVHNPQLRAPQRKYHTCPEHNIRIAAFTAQHMTESIHVATRWVILPEFAGAKRGHTSKHHSVMAPNLQSMPFTCSHPRVITYSCITLQETGKKQHPPFTIQMTSSTRTSPVTALPDSGADISAAGQVIIGILRYHLDNLALSEISPKAVNRACMKQVGKIPVIISLQGRTYRDDIHIFSGSIWCSHLMESCQRNGYTPSPVSIS